MLDSGLETSTDNAETRRALAAADPATLLLALVQLTGEPHWLEAAKPFIRGPMSYQEFMPEELRASIRAHMREVLAEIARTGEIPHRQIDDALLREMMAVATGEAVSDDYIAMMREDLTSDSLQSRCLEWRRRPSPDRLNSVEVVIIGAGMSGLYAAIQLQQAGIPFVILEKNDAVGGTWYENIYPGCGVDTPNHFYSYAFEPNHDWSNFLPSATSFGIILKGSPTNMICESISGSAPKWSMRGMMRQARAGRSRRKVPTERSIGCRRVCWCLPSAYSTGRNCRIFPDWPRSPGPPSTPRNGIKNSTGAENASR